MYRNRQVSVTWPRWSQGLLTLMLIGLFLLFGAYLIGLPKVKAASGINETLNYQGRLLTATGAVVPDGSYNIEYKIYQDGDGVLGGGDETLKWTETREGSSKVLVKNGYFSVYLGSVTAFAGNIDWDQNTLWLTTNIGGTGSPSYDGEMTPFTRLSSSPYALNSGRLGGKTAGNFVQLAQGLQTDASTGNASIAINKTGSTADIINLQRNGASVFLINNSGATTFQNTTNSTTAFQIQNAAGTSNLFNADTTNGRIGIGTASPSEQLHVQATKAASNVTTLTRNLSATGYSSVLLGNDNYNNAGLFYYGSNYAVGYSDALLLYNLGGKIMLGAGGSPSNFTIETNGAARFQNSTDTTTAFQVQNLAGTNVLTVDTVNRRVGIGSMGSPTHPLEVRGNINNNHLVSIYNYNAGANATSFLNFGNDAHTTLGYLAAVSSNFAGLGGPNSLNLVNYSNSNLTLGTSNMVQATIGSTGATLFKNSSNSATAFQVQNAAGNPILAVNTTDSKVAVAGLTSCLTLASDANNYLTCSTGSQLSVGRIEVVGHSYTQGSPDTRYSSRLASLLHADELNRGSSGSSAYSYWPTLLQSMTRSRTAAPYNPAPGIGVINYGINDIGWLGSSLGPYEHGMRTIIARMQASAVFEDSHASVTLGGTWVNSNNTTVNSGSSYKYSSTNGSTYTIAVPADFPGGTVDVGLIGSFNGDGAVHSYTVDGAGAGSIDTRNTGANVNSGGIGSSSVGLTKRFTNLSPGAHTIVGTISSVTGNTYFDYWQIESTTPRLVVLNGVNRLSSTGYNFYPNVGFPQTPNDTTVAAANTILQNLAAEFGSNVVYADIDSVFNGATNVKDFIADQLHPNEQGTTKIAAKLYRTIASTSQTLEQQSYQTSASPYRLSSSGNAIFMGPGSTDSTTAFQIQNTSGVSVFNVDTVNKRVGIGTTTIAGDFQVQGATDGAVYQLTYNTYNGAAAYSAYILGTNTFAFAGGLIATSGSFTGPGGANALVLQNNLNGGNISFVTHDTSTSTSKSQATIATNGATTFKNTVNSISAFQVQNAAGANIFNVDSTNGKIGTINTAVASTDSQALVIKSGDASGATSNSGAVTIDSGSATGTAGNISIGTGAYAHNTTIGSTTGSSAVTIQAGSSGGVLINPGMGLAFTGATSNFINYGTVGIAAPTFTNRSAGTKIILYNALAGSSGDYALGIESATLWQSVANTGAQFKWYGGTSQAAILSGTGNLTLGTGSGTLTAGEVRAAGGNTLSIATNANNKTINIGAVGTTANTTTINIANTTGNAAQTINIGASTNSGSSIALKGGATTVNIQNAGVGIGATAANGLLTIGTNTTTASGGMYFGTDTNLYRQFGGVLRTDGILTANPTSANAAFTGVHASVSTNNLLAGYIAADTQFRFVTNINGLMSWGPGGSTAPDTNLYRSAAAMLATDGSLTVKGATQGYNAAAAALYVGMDTGTGRSINVAGSISAPGADYAEWIEWKGAKPATGSIVSYRGSGYVVSSKDTAAFIGNDKFKDSDAILVTFAGQVPVRVTGAVNVGDILVANGDGTAKAVNPGQATIGQMLTKIAIAQEANSNPGVKLVNGSIGTTSDSVASAFSNLAGFSGTGGVVTDEELASDGIKSSDILTEHLDAFDITANNLTAKNIKANSITTDKLKANQIDGLEILVNRITAKPASDATAADASNRGSQAGPALQLDSFSTITAVISDDLSVNGTLFANGALKVAGPVDFLDKTFFHKIAQFIDKVIFKEDVEFKGRVAFNSDSAGFATIHPGQTEVAVKFSKPYGQPPVVTVTNKNGQFVQYAYKDLTAAGFTIVLAAPAEADLEFAWAAANVPEAKNTHVVADTPNAQ